MKRLVPNGPIANKAAMVKVMAWHLNGYKPLHEPMLTIWRQKISMSYWCNGIAQIHTPMTLYD